MKNTLLLFIVCVTLPLYAQVGINTTTPDASAALDVQGVNKGMLVPRVSLDNVATTQIDGTNTAATGLLIYNTNASTVGGSGIGFYMFNGTIWDRLTTSADGMGGNDADFFEEGTTNAPNSINDDIYTQGNLAIGKNTADYPLDIVASGARGTNVLMEGTDNNIKVATRNEISNTGTGQHFGMYNLISGSGSGTKRGIENRFLGAVNGNLIGVENSIILSNGSNSNKTGTLNFISSNGNGDHTASRNSVTSSGTGNQYASDISVSGIGTGDFYGNRIAITGGGINKYGSYIDIDEASTGTHYGVYSQALKLDSYAGYFLGRLSVGTTTSNNYILPTSRGTNGQVMQTDGSGNVGWVDPSTIAGADADFFEEGTTSAPNDINDNIFTLGNVAIGKNTANYPLEIDATSLRGLNTVVRGTDNAIRYGIYNEIANTGIGDHFGFYNLMAGTSNATKYGLYNFITNSGSAPQFGVRNQIINAGTGNRYGTFNNIAAFNANAVYATYNFVDGGSTGDRFGNYNQISNTGTGRLYGSFTTLGGAGTGIKFGDYITVANSVPGTHYGVYSDVIKAGSFAGYFRGNLAVGTTDFTSGTPNYYIFPSSRGTANQIMQTDASGNVSWVDATAIGQDADFYEEGTTTAPDNINDDIYTLGNVAIGKNTTGYPLEIETATLNRGINIDITGTDNNIKYGSYTTVSNTGSGAHYGNRTILNSGSGQKFGNQINITGLGGSIGTENILFTTGSSGSTGTYNQVNSDSGQIYGVNNLIFGSGSGQHYGVRNTVTATGDAALYGTFNNITATTGSGAKYGSYNVINPASGGFHFGVYSSVLKPTGFAGYFLGNVSIGTTTANNYILPASRGTNGQIMQTDGSGNVSWVNLPTQSNDWSVTGNSGTNPSTNFLGTIDNVDLVFRRNNIWFGSLNISNLSLGSNTHSAITTGLQNTAFGTSVQRSLTTGSFNAGVGYLANFSLTTGSQNTAVGNLANLNNQTSNNNTAIGARALQDNTAGGNNVAVGVVASYRNTSGSRNVSVGDGALQENETGSNNVSIGYFSALVKETSNNNVFIGSLAGYDNSGAFTSSNNVMIGSGAGRSSQNATGNVFLGYNAGSGVTANNKLYIENSASSTPLIYGEFDNNILVTYGEFQINDPALTSQNGVLQNDNDFAHSTDPNINFGTGGNSIMLSTQEGIAETGGIHIDGNSVVIWSPADNLRALRILDEDNWNDNDGNPYNNASELAYIDNVGQYVQASDQNRKQNLQFITNALNKIEKINGYTYEYKLGPEEKSKGERPLRTSGVLAQELYKVLPEAVQVSENGEYFVHYAGITPLLIEALKELKAENETLKVHQVQLEARLTALEAKMGN